MFDFYYFYFMALKQQYSEYVNTGNCTICSASPIQGIQGTSLLAGLCFYSQQSLFGTWLHGRIRFGISVRGMLQNVDLLDFFVPKLTYWPTLCSNGGRGIITNI